MWKLTMGGPEVAWGNRTGGQRKNYGPDAYNLREVQPLRGNVVGRPRREDEERKLGIKLLSDEEVVTRLNAFVEAWEQLQVAEKESERL